MGSLVGNLVTKKKRKKLNKLIAQESQNQVELAQENVQFEQQAQDIQQNRANFQMSQNRIEAAREARLRKAQMIASGVNAGAGNTTTLQGATDSLFSQLTGNLGKLNVFASISEQLSGINTELAQNQSDIIASQGRQQAYGAKLQTQQEKAQLIGSAIDTGIGLSTMFMGGIGLVSGFSGAIGSLGGTAATAAAGARNLWGSTGTSSLWTNFTSSFR